jgi:hypothetical protein
MKFRISIACLVALGATTAFAQDDDPGIETLDLTIALMPEGASLPEAVTRVIELPAAVTSEATRENAARGLDQANGRLERREAGLEKAFEASQVGRENAQQGREDVGRGPPDWAGSPGTPETPVTDPPGPPADLPGPPETPGPPGN